MPAEVLNNVPTQAAYVDALTVVFLQGRPGFSVIVAQASVLYQVAYMFRGDREPSWLPNDKVLFPSFAGFRDPATEGLPQGSMFGGIRFKSNGTTPGIISVA